MRVFVSWSGKNGEAAAEALEDFLQRMGMGLTIWRSGSSLDPGTRWRGKLAQALASTKFGVVCLTPEALSSPYVNFEAGALSRDLDDDARLIPFLIGQKEVPSSHPLSVFQCVEATRQGTLDLVRALHKQLDAPLLPVEKLESQMDLVWADLETALNAAAKGDGKKKPPKAGREQGLDDVTVSQQLLDYMESISRRLVAIERGMPPSSGTASESLPREFVRDFSDKADRYAVYLNRAHVAKERAKRSSDTSERIRLDQEARYLAAMADVYAKVELVNAPKRVETAVLETSQEEGLSPRKLIHVMHQNRVWDATDKQWDVVKRAVAEEAELPHWRQRAKDK